MTILYIKFKLFQDMSVKLLSRYRVIQYEKIYVEVRGKYTKTFWRSVHAARKTALRSVKKQR